MKEIKLTQGKVALVDDEDYEELNKHKWYCNHLGYASRGVWNKEKKNNDIVLMHNQIMGTPKGMDTDHLNGIKLDNQRSNLRICTHAQNTANVGMRTTNKSGFKGVTWCERRNKWLVCLTCNYKQIHLGGYLTIEEAALVYDAAARKYFGEFARLNFPDGLANPPK